MHQPQLCQPWEHRLSRRRLLGTLAGGALATQGEALGPLFAPAMAEELRAEEKQAILIWLDGGLSQLESWDPKPKSPFGGPFRSIATSAPGIEVCELLSQTAKQMHHLALLRSVCTQDNSHSAGVARINRGDPKDRGVVYPFLGSAVAKLLGPTSSGLPPYIWIKPQSGGFKAADAGFLGARYGALALGDGKPPENLLLNPQITPEENELRNELRQRFNTRYAARRRREIADANSYVFDLAQTLMRREDLFDESKITDRDRERYGTHELGRHILQGRRMLEAGVRFVKVNSYHWDSHGDNFNACDSLVRQFDQPFAALIEDLADRGMLDNVLVIVLSEFGRTPKINSHVGRDHWPEAWSVAMAGTGLKRGVAVGKTNADGTFVDGPPHDIGHLFHTWLRALGVPPENMSYDNHGQPLPVANEACSAVGELLA
ncbi:MAG: DUF1501 domain-containing protein [Planctomycetota bacterium]|nr:DUF1501 domain-containing protein [Planctomycetota bacterium]